MILKLNRSSYCKLLGKEKGPGKWRNEGMAEIKQGGGEWKSNLFKCHKIRIYKVNLATTGVAQIPF